MRPALPRFAFALTLVLLALGPAAHAQPATRARAERGPSETGFWAAARHPGLRRARELLRQGRTLLGLARGAAPAEATVRILAARRRFQRAHELLPEDAEIALALAETLASPQTEDERYEEAEALLLGVRARRPRFEAERVAFQLAVLASHTGDFAGAAREYRRSLEAAEIDRGASTVWANLAEVEMLAGDLASAERDYRRAVEEDADGAGPSLTLSLFGLAVCLDRRGATQEAESVMARALALDGTSVLRSPGVFFEPAAEIHYYEGLAASTRAARADNDRDRRRQLRLALLSFRRYLSDTPPDGPFRAAAEVRMRTAHDTLRALEGSPARRGGRGRGSR